MQPLEATMAPVMISMLFRSMKPAVQPLSPEKAFRTEITTGMSAPPMGSTK